MIVVDTSALMAVLLGEPAGPACQEVLVREAEPVMSAGSLAEALLVSDRRGVGAAMAGLIEGLGMVIAPVDAASARRVAAAYARWGRGVNPAGLNFGDCFAYAEARLRGAPLLFVGEDFSRTDIVSALA